MQKKNENLKKVISSDNILLSWKEYDRIDFAFLQESS